MTNLETIECEYALTAIEFSIPRDASMEDRNNAIGRAFVECMKRIPKLNEVVSHNITTGHRHPMDRMVLTIVSRKEL